MKTIVTVTGIRPDFIRMSAIFKLLDEKFCHILCHTGQHFDRLLSDVFFEELDIRKPDYNLEIGGPGKQHYHQTADLSVKLIELVKSQGLKPDLFLFLGDSNSVLVAPVLRKEGYKVGHIEAGMRSHDKRMLEEINRIVCDHCSNLLFAYHEDYKQNLIKENINEKGIEIVGNTIVEVCTPMLSEMLSKPKTNEFILMDIHRPENFNYPKRLHNIIAYANLVSSAYKKPVKMLSFGRTMAKIKEFGINLGEVEIVELMSYKQYLTQQYNAFFMISDSGTAQEEPALLNTPVVVPREYTERPQSVYYGCSVMLDVNTDRNWMNSLSYIEAVKRNEILINSTWLGNGQTSRLVLNKLWTFL